MSTIYGSDALALVKRAQTDVSIFSNPVSWFFYSVSWLFRKIVWIPNAIKNFITFYNHPEASIAGLLLRDVALGKNCAWIMVACRIVSVVRPLIDLSASCGSVRENAKSATKSVFDDKQSACVYFQAKGIIRNTVLKYPILFWKYVIPNFAKRLGDLIVSSGKVAWFSFDLYESLTASDTEIAERSIAELCEMVKQVQSGRLLEAITCHEAWIKTLLSKFKTKVSIEVVKDIVIDVGNINTKKLSSMSFTDMVLAVTARARSRWRT